MVVTVAGKCSKAYFEHQTLNLLKYISLSLIFLLESLILVGVDMGCDMKK